MGSPGIDNFKAFIECVRILFLFCVFDHKAFVES